MKTPRLEDFDQIPRRPVRELYSPLDDMPRIEKPGHRAPPPSPALDQPTGRPGGRTTGRRVPIRRGFEFYSDQLVALKKLSLQDQLDGKTGNMSQMVREAVDEYLKKRMAKIPQ